MAANSKMTPRQKMINMLYLVLTAILALNVSSEVLDAFKTVNDGIDLSNSSQKQSNEALYAKLNKQYNIDPKRAQEAYEKSQQVRALSKQLNDLLEKYKQQMIAESGGIDAETGKIKRDDDVNVPTHIMVENNAANGKQLKQQILDTRNKMLALLNDKDRKSIEPTLALKIEEPKEEGVTWEHAKFNSVPTVAAVTLLSKYQSDVLAAEGHIVERLYGSINGENVEVVDVMEAKVISPSSYILQGEQYNADVMVAASSSTLIPEVFVGSFTSAVKRNGKSFEVIESSSDAVPLTNAVKVTTEGQMGKLALSGSATGNKKYTGVVRVKSGSGSYKFYPFEGEYQVAQKSAVVSPVMMNVLYIGLDNPLNISVPGVAQSDVSASIAGAGSLSRKADGSYTADVKTPGPLKVIVKARVNGKEMVMGEQQFRVKRVPDPISTVDGVYETGKVNVSRLKAMKGVVPLLKGFEYETKFTVVGFDLSYNSKKDATITPPQAVQGPLFDAKCKALLNRAVAGDAIFIDNIIVRGPDGTNRKINSIAFNVIP
jgi:gliding motility-associated protein GldM